MTTKEEKKQRNVEEIVFDALKKQIEESGVSKDGFDRAIDKSCKYYLKQNSEALNNSIIEMARSELSIPRKVEFQKPKGKVEAKVVHKQFDDLVKIVTSGVPTLLVGMPGTGKTSAAEQVSELLGLSFNTISVGIQTTKSDILGFIDAGGSYRTTGFREAFEKGGVFLMDEVDAGNPNVLIVINSAISNGFCNFPDGMVKAHDDFRFIATANTFGTGADSKFIGRNQLDEATLDRFITVNFEIDEDLEYALVENKAWLAKVRSLRTDAKLSNRDILVTPRVSMYGSNLIEAGFTDRQAAEMTILKGKDKDTKDYIIRVMSL